MENKVSPFKPAFNSGIILAIVSIVISVIIWVFGIIQSMGLFGGLYILLISLVVTLVLLVIFTKSYRDTFYGGKITYGKAFTYAFLVVIFSTLIVAVYNYIFNTLIDPDYTRVITESIQDKTVAMLEKSGAGADAIDEVLIKFEEEGVPSAFKQVWQGVLGGVIGGAIMALISSAIVKKDTTEV